MDGNIYDMGLHDSGIFNGFRIVRVPGGWLYYNYTWDMNCGMNGIFVPFDNEFMPEGDMSVPI